LALQKKISKISAPPELPEAEIMVGIEKKKFKFFRTTTLG
jgi:hypothetical protein